MNAAFSIWKERIAPVFDVASQVAIVSKKSDSDQPTLVPLASDALVEAVSLLKHHHASVLVCGAISRPLYNAIISQGISVHSFVTGNLSDVIQAWRTNVLPDERFRMPGCGLGLTGRGRQNNRARQRRQMGRGGSVNGGTGVSPQACKFSGQQTVCRCGRCGYEIAHVPGVACSKHRCPNCHAPMVRA